MKIDPKEISELVSTTMFQEYQQRLTSLDYCSWAGVGKIIELMADNGWFCRFDYNPQTNLWTAEFSKAFHSLKPNQRTARVEALATTEKLDLPDAPVVFALAFLCTHKTISPDGLAQTYGLTAESTDDDVFTCLKIA